LKDTRIALAIAALVLAGSASADAQARGKFTTPARGAVRQAVQPRTADRQVAPVHVHSVRPAVPVAFTLLPAVIMSDGRVFANFGFGYEPVSRPCAPAFVAAPTFSTSAIPVVAGNGIVLSSGTPTMQPPPMMTPNSPSATQPTHVTDQVVVTNARADACFRHEPTGRVVVVW
jgi:hypothetical protein